MTLGVFLVVGALGWSAAVVCFTYYTSGPGAHRG